MTRFFELATTLMEGTLPRVVYRPNHYGDTKRLPIPTAVRRKAVSIDRQTGGTVLIGGLVDHTSGFPLSLFPQFTINLRTANPTRKTQVQQLESRLSLCCDSLYELSFAPCFWSLETELH